MEIKNMPKLESPFVRELSDKGYLVTDKIAEGYEWVFEDEEVIATEKLDGTNVSIVIENGKITRIFNRDAEIPFFNKGKRFIIEGIQNSYERGYCNFTDGQYFGELIGPKLQGNPYKLKEHIWIPFDTYCRKKLAYKSWGKYPKTFESMSEWLKTLMPLFALSRGDKEGYAEGIVFVRPSTGEMAKLRKDMYEWHKGKKHKARTEEE